MNINTHTNLFSNQITFNPLSFNNNFHYKLFTPRITYQNEDNDNKQPIINNNQQINPMFQINYFNPKIIFPSLETINKIKSLNTNTNAKLLANQNLYINNLNSNCNLFNNFNNNLPSPPPSNTLFNTNPINNSPNNQIKQNVSNGNLISNGFLGNKEFELNNDLLNSIFFPYLYKPNFKINDISLNNIMAEKSSSGVTDDSIKLNFPLKNTISKKNIFKLETEFTKKKRGRVSRDEQNDSKPKRVHKATDFDNILRKIQVHYLTFIIHFCNEILETIYPKSDYKFLNIGYNLKKTVNHSYVEHLKNCKLSEILVLPPSPKYKIKSKENKNIKTYEIICRINPFLKNFFEITYLELFNKYYIKNSKNFWFDGIEINFKKTNFFCDLLKSNPSSEKKMEEIANVQFKEKNKTVFVVNKD